MITFNDLKFKKHPNGRGWAGWYTFENGYRISVVCGEMAYCTPKLYLKLIEEYESFEIAILDNNNEWATKEILPGAEDDVVGWLSPDNISEIMNPINAHKVNI